MKRRITTTRFHMLAFEAAKEETRGGHTFPTAREMGLERVPSDCCVLVSCMVDEMPGVVAGKVLDCAVRLDVVRDPNIRVTHTNIMSSLI